MNLLPWAQGQVQPGGGWVSPFPRQGGHRGSGCKGGLRRWSPLCATDILVVVADFSLFLFSSLPDSPSLSFFVFFPFCSGRNFGGYEGGIYSKAAERINICSYILAFGRAGEAKH